MAACTAEDRPKERLVRAGEVNLGDVCNLVLRGLELGELGVDWDMGKLGLGLHGSWRIVIIND